MKIDAKTFRTIFLKYLDTPKMPMKMQSYYELYLNSGSDLLEFRSDVREELHQAEKLLMIESVLKAL